MVGLVNVNSPEIETDKSGKLLFIAFVVFLSKKQVDFFGFLLIEFFMIF
jgi:hypothetical protein